MKGKIYIIIGPMYSGKSTRLIGKMDKYKYQGKKCLLINHKGDSRYNSGEFVVTHTQINVPAKKCSDIKEVEELSEDYDVIGIDEGHFFGEITETLCRMADNGKIIIVVSIDERLSGKGFDIINLIPRAEKIKKLSAVCECKKKAYFTRRVVPLAGSYVGGSNEYVSICRECLNKNRDLYDSCKYVDTCKKKLKTE